MLEPQREQISGTPGDTLSLQQLQAQKPATPLFRVVTRTIGAVVLGASVAIAAGLYSLASNLSERLSKQKVALEAPGAQPIPTWIFTGQTRDSFIRRFTEFLEYIQVYLEPDVSDSVTAILEAAVTPDQNGIRPIDEFFNLVDKDRDGRISLLESVMFFYAIEDLGGGKRSGIPRDFKLRGPTQPSLELQKFIDSYWIKIHVLAELLYEKKNIHFKRTEYVPEGTVVIGK